MMMELRHTTFSTATEAADFFSSLSYARLPVRQEAYAAHGRNDDGLAIVTFARRLPSEGDELSFAFTEIPKR
jgi:hypothetical protein